MTLLRIFFTALLALLVAACGGSNGEAPPPPAPAPAEITISLSTATPAILASQTAQFQAALTGTSNTQVTYSVEGGSANGSISSTGLFINNGVLDIINGPQTLPPNFQNNGTVLMTRKR